MEKEYSIGDIVKIIDVSQQYPVHPLWFKENAPEYLDQHTSLYFCEPNVTNTFKIIKKAPKPSAKYLMLYLLQDLNTGDIFLFNAKGFKEKNEMPNNFNDFEEAFFETAQKYLFLCSDRKKLIKLQKIINDLIEKE